MSEEARKSSVCSRDSNVDPGVAELAHEGFFGAQPPLNEMCFGDTYGPYDGGENFSQEASYLRKGSYSSYQTPYNARLVNGNMDRRRYDDYSGLEGDLGMGGRYGDSMYSNIPSRHGNSFYGQFDRGYDCYCQVQSPTSDLDPFSPRSRYDLAYPAKNSRFPSSQWDDSHSGVYDQLSPRYKAESRWLDRDSNYSYCDDPDYHYSCSFRDRALYDRRGYTMDSDVSSSYTYGMPQLRYPASGSSFAGGVHASRGYDYAFEDMPYSDRYRHPFSDPSSPQPIVPGLAPAPAPAPMSVPSNDALSLGKFSRVTQARAFPRYPVHHAAHHDSTTSTSTITSTSTATSLPPSASLPLPASAPVPASIPLIPSASTATSGSTSGSGSTSASGSASASGTAAAVSSPVSTSTAASGAVASPAVVAAAGASGKTAGDSSPVSPQTQHSAQTPGGQSEEGGSEKGDDGDDSYRIDKQLIMQNLENRTVVLIRNIPNRYKRGNLEQVIAAHVHGRDTEGV